jgi:hypothetical protein
MLDFYSLKSHMQDSHRGSTEAIRPSLANFRELRIADSRYRFFGLSPPFFPFAAA